MASYVIGHQTSPQRNHKDPIILCNKIQNVNCNIENKDEYKLDSVENEGMCMYVI